MPFAVRNLSVLAYAQGFTSWHYRATDVAEATQPGFFVSFCNDERGTIQSGDRISVTGPNGGAELVVMGNQTRVLIAHIEAPAIVSVAAE